MDKVAELTVLAETLAEWLKPASGSGFKAYLLGVARGATIARIAMSTCGFFSMTGGRIEPARIGGPSRTRPTLRQ